MDYKPGDKLCSCVLRAKCGEGGYGEVWLAQNDIGEQVAVKIIRRASCLEREINGLKNYKECRHPNLLNIRHIELHDDVIIYTMDAADNLNPDGGDYLPDTLANRLKKSGRLDGKEIMVMLDGLLAGLEELHRCGLVHRDIKPDNILWVKGRPMLADVGLIALAGQNSFAGTPGFISPSLMGGKDSADVSDDFYALGKVIYCALTGMPVGKYPSLPPDKTISVDKSLGKAFRKPCEGGGGIKSTAEFRALLTPVPPVNHRVVNNPKAPQGRNTISRILLRVVLLLILSGVVYLLYRDFTGGKSGEAFAALWNTISQKQKATDVAEQEQPKTAALDKKRLARIKSFYRDNQNLNKMLTYQLLTKDDILQRIRYGTDNPRLFAPGDPNINAENPFTWIEEMLCRIYDRYTDLDAAKVAQRQAYWRNQKGDALEIQQKMLSTDNLMLVVVLDMIIREATNQALQMNRHETAASVEQLIYLRESLLNL